MLIKKGEFYLCNFIIMFNIFKYYKNIFNLFIGFNFLNESAYKEAKTAIEEAEKSDEFISASEWKKLKNKYLKKNPKEFKKALVDVNPVAEEKVSNEITKIIEEWNKSIEATTKETKNNLSQAKDKIKENNPFNRTLGYKKPYMKWDDVKVLQEYLSNNWFDTKWVDGVFWPATYKALKDFQKKVLHFRKPDWRMDLNWKTMNYIVKDLNSNLTPSQKDLKYWKEANEVIWYLNDVDKFLAAFNKIYGWQWEIISRDNWLLWIVSRLSWSSLSKLEKELKPDFSRVDKKKLAEELGIPENSPKFKEGLLRTAIIAVVSAILTWWESVVLELFGINYWENLSKWPEMRKILRAIRRTDVDMKKEMKDMYLSKDTTVAWLNEIVDVLNNPNMDTANLRRFMKEIYQPNWFQETFWIFLPDWYEEVEKLIKKFEKTWNTKDALAAVKEIYKLSHKAYVQAKKDYKEALENYEYYKKKYEEIEKDPMSMFTAERKEVEEDYENSKYFLKKARKELKAARNGLGRLWEVAARYSNLDAKRAQIEWDKFDKETALKIEKQLDEELVKLYWPRKLRKVREKLHSSQSFGYRVDINKVKDPNYMAKLLTKMNKETINWKTSVLAWVMRWVKQHYWIDFTVEEFTNAFMKTAEPTTSDYVLSNLWRERLQRFQWKINGNLFKIDLNGTPVYFKDACTNIVTVVNDLMTTVNTTNSIPIAWYVKTGLGKWSGSSSNEVQTPGSRPWEGDPINPIETGPSI